MSPRIAIAWARRAACAALAVGVLGVTAQAAQAAPVADPAVRFAPGGSAMAAAQGVAVAYWATSPCGGQVSVVWRPQAPQVNAQSSWANPVDAYADPADNSDCQVAFNPVAAFDWPKFCTVLVHEYGHLTGHPHVADPGDVMNAYYTRPIPQCLAVADPTAPARATVPVTVSPAPAGASVVPLGAATRRPARHVRRTHAHRTHRHAVDHRRARTRRRARARAHAARRAAHHRRHHHPRR